MPLPFCLTSNGSESLRRNCKHGAPGGRLPDRVFSGLMQRVQHQLVLHHQASRVDSVDFHRQIQQDLRLMQGLVFTPAEASKTGRFMRTSPEPVILVCLAPRHLPSAYRKTVLLTPCLLHISGITKSVPHYELLILHGKQVQDCVVLHVRVNAFLRQLLQCRAMLKPCCCMLHTVSDSIS